jgi:hypothetical protein
MLGRSKILVDRRLGLASMVLWWSDVWALLGSGYERVWALGRGPGLAVAHKTFVLIEPQRHGEGKASDHVGRNNGADRVNISLHDSTEIINTSG